MEIDPDLFDTSPEAMERGAHREIAKDDVVGQAIYTMSMALKTNPDKYSDWDKKFIPSIQKQYDMAGKLSDKQKQMLNKMLAK